MRRDVKGLSDGSCLSYMEGLAAHDAAQFVKTDQRW
jgi:hypothetical protein